MTAPPLIHKRVQRLMGNRFELSVVSPDAGWANERLDEAVTEICRIEKLLTTYIDESQTNQINANAGIQPVKVALEVFTLIERSLRLSTLTQGAFDTGYQRYGHCDIRKLRKVRDYQWQTVFAHNRH